MCVTKCRAERAEKTANELKRGLFEDVVDDDGGVPHVEPLPPPPQDVILTTFEATTLTSFSCRGWVNAPQPLGWRAARTLRGSRSFSMDAVALP